MRLAEALQIAGRAAGERRRAVHLLCGFTPLHLATFVKAYLSLRFPEDAVAVHTGLYGDLEGNIQRAAQSGGEGAIVVIEWSDLDPRLGLRTSGGWKEQTLGDIVVQGEGKCLRLEAQLKTLAEAAPVTFVAPTLPLPPVALTPRARSSTFELRLNTILLAFLQRVCDLKDIRLLSPSYLALRSAPAARHDVAMEIQTGFPYTLAHADTLAQLSVSCLFAPAPKKGLITDLDQTLWKGILGEVGVEAVSWSLEGKSQVHALYQQVLASLAESGVLVAIASKNDPLIVQAALERTDMLLRPEQIFPIQAGWGAKSDAVGRILKAWNINADSVVFVDDSPMELAEVSEKHPGMECLPFPCDNPAAVLDLLHQLRDLFGKKDIQVEDRLRMQSLRSAAQLNKESPQEASEDFLARLEARVRFEESGADTARAFELVNKTNQFNLNGNRYTESEWKARLRRPGAFLTTVSYEDRFGPLGRVAVLSGWIEGDRCFVDVWVMSCRAFSRQIEFQTLRQLFAKSGASTVRFLFRPTERNGPLQTFLGHFFSADSLTQGELDLPGVRFGQSCPPLFHEVIT